MLGPLHQNEHFFAGTAERILKWGGGLKTSAGGASW